MISFNEYLSEDISAEMKKAFSTKEKNNLKGLFGKLNIKAENLVFKRMSLLPIPLLRKNR